MVVPVTVLGDVGAHAFGEGSVIDEAHCCPIVILVDCLGTDMGAMSASKKEQIGWWTHIHRSDVGRMCIALGHRSNRWRKASRH